MRGTAILRKWRRILTVVKEPDLYLLVLRIYFPILFPTTFFLLIGATRVDAAMGWSRLLAPPWNLLAGGTVFLTGAALWLYTYDVFIHGGQGSPSPSIRRTQRLVTWDIYARCRNPSVLAKLLGVLGVGLMVGSPAFTLVFLPILLVGSLVEKVWRQEPVLVEVFGDEYLAYRKRVPLIVPRLFVPPEELRPPSDLKATPQAAGDSAGSLQASEE